MKSYQSLVLTLIFLIVLLFALSLVTGSAELDWQNISHPNSKDAVILEFRLLKTLTAIGVGASLPISGMLLQEYFKNVLAGPSIMGVSASAGLGVAVVLFLGLPSIWASSSLLQVMGISLAGLIGAFSCLLLLLSLSRFLNDSSHFVIIGFLISALAAAFISVMQLYSGQAALKQFVLWSFGSFSGLSWHQLGIFAFIILLGLCLSWKATHALQGNILGSLYAQSVGVNLSKMKYEVLISTTLLTGVCTAMVGPIAFVGILVPFFTRMWISEAQLYKQFFVNILSGMSLMIAISLVSETSKMPINIILSFLGIPMIGYIVLKSAKAL